MRIGRVREYGGKITFYLNPHWLKEVDRRFAASTHPKFFQRPVEVLSPRLARGRDDVLDALTRVEPPSVQEMENLIASIFSEILTLSPPRNLLQLASERVERDYDARIRKIVERMLGEGDLLCSPEDMACWSGLSRAQFFRLFKKATGLPPTLFLSMLKMETSLRKVAQRDVSLQDIAFDLGFDTAGNFTRFFVGMQGFAPSKYRKILEVV